MSAIFKRDFEAISDAVRLRFYPIAAEGGRGAYIKDITGKEYLDFNAGWAVMNVGYGHPSIIDAVTKQMEKLSFASHCSTVTEVSVELAERLIALLPGDFEKKVWFGHSGSDANELLAKVIPQATGRPRILSFVGSYHGQTMGAYALSGHPSLNHFTGDSNVIKAPYPYCYRCAYGCSPQNCDQICVKYITNYIFRSVYPMNQIGAVIVEPIQSDGGDVVPPPGFMEKIYQACKENGILFISDEVKVGYGRTGKMFGFQNFDIIPDIVVMAKPMGGGQPLSAVVGLKKILDAVAGSHFFTTAGNPVACASGLAVLDIIEKEGLIENAQKMGKYLLTRFKDLGKVYECIGQVRGSGLILGIELVENRKTRTPAAGMAASIVYRCFELGLLFFASGIHANVLEFTPPLTICEQEAEKAVGILEQAIKDVLEGNVDEKAVAAYTGWGI